MVIKRVVTLLLVSFGAIFVTAATALGAVPAPGWAVTATVYPTNLPPEGTGEIVIDVVNVGEIASSGVVTVTDTLPPGVTAIDSGEVGGLRGRQEIGHRMWDCAGTSVVTCTNNLGALPALAGGGGAFTGDFGFNLDPQIGIVVKAGAGEGTGTNSVTVAGGGASESASNTDPVTVSATPASRFGFVGWDAWASNADGTLDTQAGSHPYAFTTSIDLPSEMRGGVQLFPAAGEVRNVEVELPPGFVGDPTAVPQCTLQELNATGETGRECPAGSQVGIQMIVAVGGGILAEPLVNMVPPPGVAAEFATTDAGIKTFYDATVRSGGDYGITVHVDNIAQRAIVSIVDTFWGVPGDESHNRWRSAAAGGCEPGNPEALQRGECSAGPNPSLKPFLTLPTACGEAQPLTIRANTWQHEESSAATLKFHGSTGFETGFSGCGDLGFGPLISTSPDTLAGDSPAGLSVEVKPPVGGLENPEGDSTSDIEDTTAALPAGMVINPGQAAGLAACQSSEAHVGDGRDDAPACPLSSKIGVDEIETPLLPRPLKGNVYILQSNPPHVQILVAASGEGVNLKLVGDVELCEAPGETIHGKACAAPGQLITTFSNTPELPFTNFRLSFSGGAQAALDTPTQCGTYTTTADFTPWSSPFVPNFNTTAAFGITTGPASGACSPAALPFAPQLTAGSTTDQAGGFTNFSLLLQRGDGQQRIERLQFKAPAGLGGMLSSVPLCEEPQAAQGTCPVASRIGHASVASGPGPYPLVLPQPGEPELPIYLTGPYGGAPFGLSIVTPVLAGPFNLGTIVTRARIMIDPHTAQISVTTDPLPQVVKGVPTDLRLVDAVIDRPGFMFNPTNCNSQEFSGTAWGTPSPGAGGPGASSQIGSHFGVGSCRGLEFAPKFSVTTSGRNSKANGASLTAKLSYPSAAQGTQANIGLVKVDLPKQLPSRLTTLQKACTLAQFESNPAGCPPASFIGHAIVHTPELPVPLTGPAIFVSHGGEAFPTLTLVLQGDGVTIDVVGSTFINKAGITSTTFKTVPDAPFSTFELTLPQGPDSALATNVPAKANYSLCGQKLTMPTEFVGQNGAIINRSTPVAVTGCAKTKTLTRAQKLTLALKACHKKHNHAKRITCEHAARKKYGVIRGRSKGRGK